MAALEKEVGELRERVADLQSDKILLEEELRETVTHQQSEAQGDRSKASLL